MPNKIGHIVLPLLIFTSLILANNQTGALEKRPSHTWASECRWMTQSWDGNDKPYQQIRITIDNAINAGRKPLDLVFLYENSARLHPNDPLINFKWAYSAYQAAKLTDYNNGERILGEPREALMTVPFPRNYEYARLIFLTEDYSSFLVPYLQQVSKRLVIKSPNDKFVKYAAARNLIYSTIPADRNLGYKYANELLAKYPEWACPHGLQGFYLLQTLAVYKKQTRCE